MHSVLLKWFPRMLLLLAVILLIILFVLSGAKNSVASITVDQVFHLQLPAGYTAAEELTVSSVQDPEYQNKKGQFSFRYPAAFYLKEQAVSGGEILYHIDLANRAKTINGFVQEWKLDGTLKGFLDRANAKKSAAVYDFRETPAQINQEKGYIWRYKVKNESGDDTVATQAFFSHDGKMFVISLFTPVSSYNDAYEKAFQTILQSIQFHA